MRTYVQKPNATQQTKSAISTKPDRTHVGQSHGLNSILQLQRTIGNQAARRLVQARTEESEADSPTSAPIRLAHNLSQIPLRPMTHTNIQSKLTVSTPGDIYEQEADNVADLVMQMPNQHLHPACACGGGCSKCGQEQSGQKQLQTKSVQQNETGNANVPTIVQDVISPPGHPLDSTARAFVGPRFEYDFNRVRVHKNTAAQASAKAIQARAFTLGNDIVFGVDQYLPNTTTGRQLLAHKLTHVVQQGRDASAGQVIQRAPVLNVTTGTTSELQIELRRLTSERSSRCRYSYFSLFSSKECRRYNRLIRTLRERIRNRDNPRTADCPISLSFNGSHLSVDGVSFPAVSGRPVNGRFDYSPARQRIEGVGPIPAGTYWLDPSELTELWYYIGSAAASWGTQRITIHPFHSTHTFGRGGFFIHGGTIPESAGCIDLTGNMARFADEIRGYKGRPCKIILRVSYPIGPGDFPPSGATRLA